LWYRGHGHDQDGLLKCSDQCKDDPKKTLPGVGGCSKPDMDTNTDGTPNCKDQCAKDMNKTEHGMCRYGMSDTKLDGEMLLIALKNSPMT